MKLKNEMYEYSLSHPTLHVNLYDVSSIVKLAGMMAGVPLWKSGSTTFCCLNFDLKLRLFSINCVYILPDGKLVSYIQCVDILLLSEL